MVRPRSSKTTSKKGNLVGKINWVHKPDSRIGWHNDAVEIMVRRTHRFTDQATAKMLMDSQVARNAKKSVSPETKRGKKR